jgi:hypothetical protein
MCPLCSEEVEIDKRQDHLLYECVRIKCQYCDHDGNGGALYDMAGIKRHMRLHNAQPALSVRYNEMIEELHTRMVDLPSYENETVDMDQFSAAANILRAMEEGLNAPGRMSESEMIDFLQG